MSRTLQNIILFFREPRNLFSRLKKSPNLKGSFAILFSIVLLYQIAGIKIGHLEITPAVPVFLALLFSFVIMAGVLFGGVIYGSFYILLFCRIFEKRVNFKSILSSVIYCSIPIIFGIIVRMMYPVNLGLDSLLNIEDIHPFFKILYHRIEIFGLWSDIMEVIAISIIAEISYRESIIIIFSFWLLSIVLTYLLGLNLEPY